MNTKKYKAILKGAARSAGEASPLGAVALALQTQFFGDFFKRVEIETETSTSYEASKT